MMDESEIKSKNISQSFLLQYAARLHIFLSWNESVQFVCWTFVDLLKMMIAFKLLIAPSILL